jgi:phosphate transport system permease protein
MSTDLTPTGSVELEISPPPVRIDSGHLRRRVLWVVASVAIALAAFVAWPLGRGAGLGAVVGWIGFVTAVPILSRRVEGVRKAKDRFVTVLVWTALVVVLLPLIALTTTVVKNGAPALNAQFFTYSMRNVAPGQGGIYHAIIGTLIVTTGAALVSIPIGIMTAIYLIEYGHGALSRWITFLVDVMTGIPSIVAGLFAYALFALFFGEGVRMGFMGSIALSVLMIPIVVRSTEEMLKLVPNELREASYALGVPQWRTIVKVVLPTARAGIVTGITLAIARVVGETAPLLITCGLTDSTNLSAFHERIMTLPVYVFTSYATPSFPIEASHQRAWGAALVLMMLVLVLNLVARLISSAFSPKSTK